jgi:hypothetical protein
LVVVVGRVAIKSCCGNQANQNVPMAVVPMSVKVMLYCHSAVPIGAASMVADAASGMAGLPGCCMGVIVQYGCDGSIGNADSRLRGGVCFGRTAGFIW